MPATRPPPEEHVVRADDRWDLHVLDLFPTGEPKGVVVAGHAMMVDRRTLYRGETVPSVALTLQDRGFRVLVPDLRGHGTSGPTVAAGGSWSYDDLVRDTGPLVDFAKKLEPDRPLALLGHSLFGHTSLAWLGQHPDAPVDAHVSLAVDVWQRRDEPDPFRWALKRAILEATFPLARLVGHVPARRLGMGPADEPLQYWLTYRRWVRTGSWDAEDGTDHRVGLQHVRCPALTVVSEGDHLYAHPASAKRFARPLPNRTVWHVGIDTAPEGLRDVAPGHMGMVVDPESRVVWEAVGRWLEEKMGPQR